MDSREYYPSREQMSRPLTPRRKKSPLYERSPSPSLGKRRSSPYYLERNRTLPHYAEKSYSPSHRSRRSRSPFYLRRSKSPASNLLSNDAPPRGYEYSIHYSRDQSPPQYLRKSDSSSHNLKRKSRSPEFGFVSPPRYSQKSPRDYLEAANSKSASHDSEAHSTQFTGGPLDTYTRSPRETNMSMKLSLKPEVRNQKIMSLQEVDEMTDDGIHCKRISGASKKKVRSLISQGIPYIQAKRTVLKENFIRVWSNQMKVKTRMQNSGVWTSAESQNLSAQIDNEKVNRGTDDKQSFRPDSKHSKIEEVTVVHAGYPGYRMTPEQLKTVQTAIMRVLEGLARDGPQVRFLKSTYGSGCLVVTCADETSSGWLKNIVPQLKPWEGAVLGTFVENKVRHSVKCIVFVPDEFGHVLSSKTILHRLELSNRGLLPRLWSTLVHIRRKHEKGQVWKFDIDMESLEKLKELKMKPYFGFGTIKFRLKGGPPQIGQI